MNVEYLKTEYLKTDSAQAEDSPWAEETGSNSVDDPAYRVLILDDDKAFRDAVCRALENSGRYMADAACTLEEARRIAEDCDFDAYILDVMLEPGDGRDFCTELRQRGVAAPIIMLTGLDDEENTIHGLESGATDYVGKPLRAPVLIARLDAHLRQVENQQDAAHNIGGFIFRPGSKKLENKKSGKVTRLTEKEVLLLNILLNARGRTVPRSKLLRQIWGYSGDINTHTLETHVYRLRQKFKQMLMHDDSDSARSLLLTDDGGYRLNTR